MSTTSRPEHASREAELDARPSKGRGLKRTVAAYVALTKPRVMELLLVSTVPVMFLAAGGVPNLWLVAATVIGGAMSAGSAASFNMYLDRDIDKVMKRTKNRPLVTGEVSPREVLVFSWALAVVQAVWLLAFTNLLTVFLSTFAIFFYVVIYTILLKRHTEQNIVWGGIAGCFPVLVGWAAVTNSLAWAPFVAVRARLPLDAAALLAAVDEIRGRLRRDRRADARRARGSGAQVGLQVVLYAWATVACSLLLIPIASMGLVYSASAVVFGAWFIYESHRMYAMSVRAKTGAEQGSEARPMRVFHASITYLTLVFVAVAVDPLLPF